MDESSRIDLEEEREGVVALLRIIADRLHALNLPEAHRSVARLALPLALLAREAEAVVGPLPARWAHSRDDSDPPRQTVVFVHRGATLEA